MPIQLPNDSNENTLEVVLNSNFFAITDIKILSELAISAEFDKVLKGIHSTFLEELNEKRDNVSDTNSCINIKSVNFNKNLIMEDCGVTIMYKNSENEENCFFVVAATK